MTETMDQLGPVDWLVVSFPGDDYGKGQVAPLLQDLVDRGLVRVLDLLFMKKELDGSLQLSEISDLDSSESGELRHAEADLAMVLSEQDVTDLAETIEPGNSAAGAGLGERLGRAVRLGRPARGRPAGRQRTHPDPSGAGRRRGRHPGTGRSLRCPSQPDAGAAPRPPSVAPSSSPTA